MLTVGTLFENLLVCGVVWCGVLSSSHRSTPHTIGAKQLNPGFIFVLIFVVSHILKIL